MPSTSTDTAFQPVPGDFDHIREGVPVTWFPSGDAIAHTTHRQQAITALNAVLAADGDDTGIDPSRLKLRWLRFEKQPAGAEHAWIVSFADEGDEATVQAHYLFHDA